MSIQLHTYLPKTLLEQATILAIENSKENILKNTVFADKIIPTIINQNKDDLAHTLTSINCTTAKDNQELYDLFECNDTNVLQLQIVAHSYAYYNFYNLYLNTLTTKIHHLEELESYWNKEYKNIQASFLQRNIMYHFYSDDYKNQLINNLELIGNIKIKLLHTLGLCLQGKQILENRSYQYENVTDNNELIATLTKDFLQAATLLHKEYHLQMPSITEQKRFYSNLNLINSQTDTLLNSINDSVSKIQQPSYLQQHWVGIATTVGALAITSIILAYQYQQHKNQIPEWNHKAYNCMNVLWKDYIKTPCVNIINIFRNDTSIPNSEKSLETLQNRPHPGHFPDKFDNALVDSMVNIKPFIDPVNNNIDMAYETKKAFTDLSHMAKNTMHSQRLNSNLLVIMPVIAGLYAAQKGIQNIWKNHKQNNYFNPMKIIIHSIDQLINNAAKNSLNNFSSIEHAQIYLLASQLEKYNNILSHTELQMIQPDIVDLQSTLRSINQKQAILERMYHTYDFLK